MTNGRDALIVGVSVPIGPRTLQHPGTHLPAADVAMDAAVLNRVDEMVTPGRVINPADSGFANPAWILRPAGADQTLRFSFAPRPAELFSQVRFATLLGKAVGAERA
ncbi:hypothetical protein [Streptomyces sp. IBSBF 2806]|uniref:hypothetical protein n=1 Tax=Streptomyces sp. IBSBF 2806 TaxID=2903529 RepID=UPI002FDC36D7